jgi:hypothetical protein
MERNANESFAAYKVRRAAASLAVKHINWNARSGGQSARAKLREFAPGFHTGIKGVASSNRTSMGAGIAASAAAKRATSARLWTHRMHVAYLVERKAERAAANDSRLTRAA